MEIINIIKYNIHYGIQNLFQYIEDDQTNIACKAEKVFKNECKKINPQITKEELSDSVDNGFYSHNGYEIYLRWSNIEK